MDSDNKDIIKNTNQRKSVSEKTSLVCQPEDLFELRKERYQLFVDQASDGFYETDILGAFTFFNDAFCRIFGRTRREMQNRNFRDFMDPENARSAARRLKQISDRDKVTQIVWNIIHKNGQMHTLEVSARPIFGADGQHVGFRGMARDVTNRIRAQKAIIKSRKKIKQLYDASQETEQRYRAFLKFLPLPLLVHNLDFSVAYLNPAFEATFGWTKADLDSNPLAHIPEDQLKTTQMGKVQLLENGAIAGLETKRLTKDGRILDVIHDGSVFYDHNNIPAGMVVALRDITKSKKDARTSQSLFKIAEALHHYRDLDSLLAFITKQVQSLLHVQHAHIILVDNERKEYYFRTSVVKDTESHQRFSQTRMPLDDNYFAGQVILTGKPRIVNHVTEENIRLKVTKHKDLHNILGVPMELGNQIIGAMAATNKIDTKFNQEDIDLLSSIARMVSLPIENARINDELRNSYEEIKSLNKAKDRIIDHLSHELRTPLSVLSASLSMLTGNQCPDPDTAARILARSQRNIERLRDMQAKIVDITRNPDQRIPQTLTALLELCADELESLVDMEIGTDAGQRIRRRIDEFFEPKDLHPQQIALGPFVSEETEKLKPDFSHRRVEFSVVFHEDAGCVNLPVDVLSKIIKGLVRNAIEYTPDGGRIQVIAQSGDNGPELVVSDTGVGITEENQQLIFGNYFTTADISQYGTGKPYDFNAGGSGFDLLRMRVFSERYHFKILIDSRRCPHIPSNEDNCPGSTEDCIYCDTSVHCHHSGGTRFTVQFSGMDESGEKE